MITRSGLVIVAVIQPWNIAMQKLSILNFALCLLLPISAVAEEDGESPSLKKLHQAIAIMAAWCR